MLAKLKESIKNQITQGATPEKLSQSLTAGILIGCFPVIGVTTLLSGLAGYFFKMNHIVIQSANYLMYPVQILMVPVYIKLTSMIVDLGDVPIRPDLIIQLFKDDKALFFKQYALVGLYSVILWLIVAPLIFYGLNRLILPFVKRIKNNFHQGHS